MQRPTLPSSEHDRQGPGQAESQQTPATQKPLAHSALTEHSGSRRTWQKLREQRPLEHCASVTHVSKQRACASSHKNGAHENTRCGAHVPLPSHVGGSVNVAPTHLAPPQMVPAE